MNKVRAQGRVVTAGGIGVTGRGYFYPTVDAKPQHITVFPNDGGVSAPAIYGTASVFSGVNVGLVGADHKSGVGYFDVEGGLPPGTYRIEVHTSAGVAWAWPYVVPAGGVSDVPQVQIGGPSTGVPSGKHRVVVLFGDSDTSNPGPKVRNTSLDIELAAPTLTVINRAEGNLPVGTQTEPEGVWAPGPKRSGLDIVRKACAEIPVIDVAVLRYGLNDAHYYLSPVTPVGVAKFRGAYGSAIDALKAKGAQVMVCEICLEGGDRDRNADVAINAAIRDLAREKGCILISPNIDAENDPKNYIDNSDQVHLTNAGTRYVAGLIRDALGSGGVVIPSPGDAPPVPALAKQFTDGTFVAAVSLYSLGGAPLDRAKRDLSRFRAAGFGNARVWIDWGTVKGHEMPGCAALDADGNFIEPVAKKFDELLLYCESIGMSLDLTMHADHYRTFRDPDDDEKYDISAHLRAIRNTLVRWGRRPAVRILDVANEAEVRGEEPGSGSPATGHVSPGRFGEMMDVARSVPHTCLVGASVSGGGDFPGDVTKNYQALFRSAKGEILLPHFARNGGWGAKEGARGADLRRAIPGLPAHHQEPARNGHAGTQSGKWPLSEFEASFRTTKAAGAVGCCFHTDAGFDMRSKDAWDQLDEVERQVVEKLRNWI